MGTDAAHVVPRQCSPLVSSFVSKRSADNCRFFAVVVTSFDFGSLAKATSRFASRLPSFTPCITVHWIHSVHTSSIRWITWSFEYSTPLVPRSSSLPLLSLAGKNLLSISVHWLRSDLPCYYHLWFDVCQLNLQPQSQSWAFWLSLMMSISASRHLYGPLLETEKTLLIAPSFPMMNK